VTLTIVPVEGLGEIREGDDLAALIAGAVALRDGDVVVVAQKAVSKAEGALVAVPPGEDRAAFRRRLALEQAVRVVADAPWTVIVETRHGLVCAMAGIDASNVAPGHLALLPENPDASAARLRADLETRSGRRLAVLITDTFGRPWRRGQTDVAIGLSGLPAIRDERADRHGTTLEVTEPAAADELAGAADLVRTKSSGTPVVVIRGHAWPPDEDARAADLIRPAESDLFPRGRGALADLLARAQEDVGPGTVSAGDRRRALAAARAGGDGRVVVEGEDRPDGGWAVTLAVATAEAHDLMALGGAIATLRAALYDLGFGMRPREGADPLRRVVDVGRPEPGTGTSR
jgi:coenzyme F420-0:L-glutamate ligase/coenzyme F420-1:gamma-L-glutamate ligase